MESTVAYQNIRSRFPWYGYLALVGMAISEVLMLVKIEPFYTWFTPIQWTGYIFFLDALLVRFRGYGYIFERPREFVFMLIVSALAWFLFEGYNLYLQNWRYVHLPENLVVRFSGYVWAFATIFPGILLTSEVLDQLVGFHRVHLKPKKMTSGWIRGLIIFGILSVTVPLLVPQGVARYLFAFVWIGYIFLLDPINYKLKRPSLLAQLERGSIQKLLSLFLSGLICGVLWEFWNYWAAAKWVYTVPFLNEPKIFEMPLFGYLGFLPFAVECFVLWQFMLHFWKPNHARSD